MVSSCWPANGQTDRHQLYFQIVASNRDNDRHNSKFLFVQLFFYIYCVTSPAAIYWIPACVNVTTPSKVLLFEVRTLHNPLHHSLLNIFLLSSNYCNYATHRSDYRPEEVVYRARVTLQGPWPSWSLFSSEVREFFHQRIFIFLPGLLDLDGWLLHGTFLGNCPRRRTIQNVSYLGGDFEFLFLFPAVDKRRE